MKTRRQFMGEAAALSATAALAPLAGASTAQAAPTRRPNLLLLYPDQWRFDWMSANTQLPIRTPNLDRLARTGTRLTNLLVASPLCAPSRACLAAGMEYERAGVPSNSINYPIYGHKTFYTLLRDSGYHVMGCGKMDLAKGACWWGLDGKWRLQALGFSEGINNAGKMDQLVGYLWNNKQPADPYTAFLDRRGLLQQHLRDLREREHGGYAATDPTPLPDDAYCDNWVAQNGLALLDAAPKDKPWFLQVNWAGPHDPEDVTARMEATVLNRPMPPVNGTNEYDAPTNAAIRRNYTAMCENIDRTIGLFLDKLEQMGQLDNTIILFSSDHGEMLGDHGRWAKSVPYQPSVGVPLLASGPGIRQGAASDALISHIDLTATCLDYAGVPVPQALARQKMDSLSFRDVLEGRAAHHRDVLFSGLGAWRMAYDGTYKVITGFDPHDKHPDPSWTVNTSAARALPPLVFDMERDPGENHDLAAAMPAQVRQLLDRLNARTAQFA